MRRSRDRLVLIMEFLFWTDYVHCYETPAPIFCCRRLLSLDNVRILLPENITLAGFLPSVQINNCNIAQVGEHMLSQVSHLLVLNLKRNRITHLEPKSFSGLHELLILELQYNLIHSLSQTLFHDLRDLMFLSLTGNQLTSIGPMLFSNLHKLITLELESNQLSNISDTALGEKALSFTDLVFVDLSDNKLIDFPLWLLEAPSLQSVDLNDNNISFDGIQSFLSRMSEAEFIQSSPITTSKRIITLHDNEFNHFDISRLSWDEIYQFGIFMSYVYLDRGDIFQCDCRMYPLFTCFRALECRSNVPLRDPRLSDNANWLAHGGGFKCSTPADVQGMSLVDLSPTVFGCYEDVDGCPQTCRCWVRSWDEAVRVECSNKNLTHLPSALPDLTIELNYSANLLTDIPPVPTKYFGSIQVVDLSHNSIKYVSEDAVNTLSNVTRLYLHDNKLSTLSPAVSVALL